MVKYVIYTEDKNKKDTLKLIALYLKDFTVLRGVGYYEGAREKSLLITYITNRCEGTLVLALCLAIKRLNNQKAVLYTVENIAGSFI